MKSKRTVVGCVLLVVLGVIVVYAIGLFMLLRGFLTNDFATSANNQFGDQHFKTALALVELHRLRTGSYPDELDDIQFIGDWDEGALIRVAYYPNDSHDAYCIKVIIGWAGPPSNLNYPPEFFRGTGFDPSLCP